MRSSRSVAFRNSLCTTALLISVLSIANTPIEAVYRAYARLALTCSSEYVWRLCRLNVRVTGPLCGGSVMTMPERGLVSVITSQKLILVVTPTPSGAGQTIAAGVFCAGGNGVDATLTDARRCAIDDEATQQHSVTARPPVHADFETGTERMLIVGDARQVRRVSIANSRSANPELDELEEFHPRSRVVAEHAQH